MKVLQITSHFRPNLGGVETHLNDLVEGLVKKGIDVFVLTYRPLTAPVKWKITEKENKLFILRIPWLPGLFYQLVKSPILEFLYLFPGLFIFTPFVILLFKPKVIHAHGLVAGFVGVFWGRLFAIKTIISTHSIYNFPKSGAYYIFSKLVFSQTNIVLTLSQQSAKEIKLLGITEKKILVFTYWIDLNIFKIIPSAKKELGWSNKFVVLFVGRLVKEKGIPELLEAIKILNKNIYIAIAGSGPLESEIRDRLSDLSNLIFLGRIENNNLPLYYSAADLVIVPSVHEEGFGRIIIESLACGTPVVASSRGAIPEAMDNSVGKLINITPANIRKTIEYYYHNPEEVKNLSAKAIIYARNRYSDKNLDLILSAYEKNN